MGVAGGLAGSRNAPGSGAHLHPSYGCKEQDSANCCSSAGR